MRALPALAAAVLVTLCELVLWSGQPVGEPTGRVVLAYYGGSAGVVAAGDLVWLCAVVLLARSIWVLPAPGRRRRLLLRAAAAPGLVGLAASAFVALSLAAAAHNLSDVQALADWRLEGTLYEFGALALLAPIAVVLALPGIAGRPLLAATAAAVGLLWLLTGGLPGFLASILWFGLAAAFGGAAAERPLVRLRRAS